MQRNLKGFRFRRNPSYLTSLRLGLLYGLWWAPWIITCSLTAPLAQVIGGLLGLVVRIAAWFAFQSLIILAGIVGCLIECDLVAPVEGSQG